jgi:hypothetical protein
MEIELKTPSIPEPMLTSAIMEQRIKVAEQKSERQY